MSRLLSERGPAKGWVFFTDKGLDDPAAVDTALERARLALSPRALKRRRLRRSVPGDVDLRDVPVHAPYVRAVLSTGCSLSVESSWLNAISVRGTMEQFRSIARLAFVDRIEPVRRGILIGESTTDHATSPGAPAPPGAGMARGAVDYGLSHGQLEQLNLIALHDAGFTGAGVRIGVLDTGFHRGHEAFNQPGHEIDVVLEHDFVDDDGFTGIEPGDPSAQHNHGTMILGTIASYLPGVLVGGAFDASFILCKTEDATDEYQQEEDFYVAGLQFLEANGADMATSSLGYDDWYEQTQLDGLTAVTTVAVNAATSNGLICVTAAGNNGHDQNPDTSSLMAPGDAFEVITCGGVEPTGEAVDFSSDGPTADGRVKPELLARGHLVYTICAHQDVDCTTDTGGTSVATSLMASMVACMIQARPEWTPATMRSRLFETAGDFLANGTFDPLYVRGYGVPDAALAALVGTGLSDLASTTGRGLLEQNVPNPFLPATTIAYTVPRDGVVRLAVFDVSGRLVRRLVGAAQEAGRHEVVWDGRDAAGRRAAGGVYFYRLATGGVGETRRMVRLR
jgi:subtilisin family serine protease